MNTMERTVGDVLRDWRQRRHHSQLSLANDTGMSARHLSFLETGRSKPSREMLLRLADRLELPLRERNALLLAGGYAPIYAERPFDDANLRHVREAVDLILRGHEPYPALAVDRYWTMVAMNGTVPALLGAVAPSLLEPPVNVLRLTFHPDGLAPIVDNPDTLFPALLARLDHEVSLTADPRLAELRDELVGYPVMKGRTPSRSDRQEIVVPFALRTPTGVLRFISTTTVFGTATDVTVSELAIESFFPADAETSELIRSIAT
jgi:transcriptional regulator with XRE-family HTH domain